MSSELQQLADKISQSLEQSGRALEKTRLTLRESRKLLRQHVDEYQLDERIKLRSADVLKRGVDR